jgi:hypothetical protein
MEFGQIARADKRLECCFCVTDIAGVKQALVNKIKARHKIKDTLKYALQIPAGWPLSSQVFLTIIYKIKCCNPLI